MGHYASEMMCNRCGQCRCTCPAAPDAKLDKWVVDTDYSVLSAREFDAKHGYRTFFDMRLPDKTVGPMLRMCREHFDTKEQAQQHARALLDQRIAKSEAQTAELYARRQELFAAA
jgi:hypothetical protein